MKWRWLGCSQSNLAIQSWHFSKLVWMSLEMRGLVGSWILGQPAVKRSHNSQSLMILMGWLFSINHLTRCALHLIVSSHYTVEEHTGLQGLCEHGVNTLLVACLYEQIGL